MVVFQNFFFLFNASLNFALLDGYRRTSLRGGRGGGGDAVPHLQKSCDFPGKALMNLARTLLLIPNARKPDNQSSNNNLRRDFRERLQVITSCKTTYNFPVYLCIPSYTPVHLCIPLYTFVHHAIV